MSAQIDPEKHVQNTSFQKKLMSCCLHTEKNTCVCWCQLLEHQDLIMRQKKGGQIIPQLTEYFEHTVWKPAGQYQVVTEQVRATPKKDLGKMNNMNDDEKWQKHNTTED